MCLTTANDTDFLNIIQSKIETCNQQNIFFSQDPDYVASGGKLRLRDEQLNSQNIAFDLCSITVLKSADDTDSLKIIQSTIKACNQKNRFFNKIMAV